jgi:hypothetical protein
LGHDISISEMALVQRCSVLRAELERRDVMFAMTAAIDDQQLAVYTTCCNTLNKLLTTLGIKRRPRDVTPNLTEYLSRRRANTDTGAS